MENHFEFHFEEIKKSFIKPGTNFNPVADSNVLVFDNIDWHSVFCDFSVLNIVIRLIFHV